MSGRVLLEGVSDFWLRYFADAPILMKAHEASLEAMGRSYQNMLMSLMRLSSKDTPLTEDSPWQNFLFYDYLIVDVPGYGFLWQLPAGVRETDLIHNVVLAPTRVLERGYDFDVVADDLGLLKELNAINPAVPLRGWFLLFKKDLFNWDVPGATCPGYALTTKVFDLPRRIKSVQIPDWETSGVVVGDTARIVVPDGTVYYGTVAQLEPGYVDLAMRSSRLAGVAAGSVTFGTATPNYDDSLGRGQPVVCTLHTVATRVRVLSAWSPYVKKDFYSLYSLYGHAVSAAAEPSTEEYRAFIRGVWNLYIGGPVLSRIESAFNVACGLPVVREDYEEILAITETSISTTKPGWPSPTIYDLPAGVPLRNSVIAAAGTYMGVERDGSLLIFTDVEYLSVQESFVLLSATPGVSVIELTDVGNAVQEVVIQFVFDAYLQLAEPVTLDLSSPLSWVIRTGVDDLAEGTSGAVVANVPSGETFNAFDAFTTVFAVTDYLETPDWWENSVIPRALLPDIAPNRRIVTPAVHSNLLNGSGDLARVGDYGLLVGRSDDGTVPYSGGLRYLFDASTTIGFVELGVVPGQTVTVFDRNGGSIDRTVLACGDYWLACAEDEAFDCDDYKTDGVFVPQEAVTYHLEVFALGENRDTAYLDFAPGEHHLVSWLLMRDFLKWNMFSVSFDTASVQFPRSQSFVIDLLMQTRPAHTFPYVSSDAGLSDQYTVFDLEAETVGVKALLHPKDGALGVENRLCIGGRNYSDFEDDSIPDDLSLLVAADYTIETGLATYVVEKVSTYATLAYAVTGSLCVFNGSNTVIGVGTSFLQELPVGRSVVIGGDTYYVIAPPSGDAYTDSYLLLDRAWSGVTQVGLTGAVPAGYSNRMRLSSHVGTPEYRSGVTYVVKDADENVVYTSSWGSGAVLGGVGAYKNAFIGGMDPLVDRHELEYTRVGLPSLVANYMVLEHLVDGNSVSNVVPGYTISLDGNPMILSDLPCIVRTIHVA